MKQYLIAVISLFMFRLLFSVQFGQTGEHMHSTKSKTSENLLQLVYVRFFGLQTKKS